jgi:hypothetical protein
MNNIAGSTIAVRHITPAIAPGELARLHII